MTAMTRRHEMTGRKLLVINPNTNPQVTERIHIALAPLASATLDIEVINPPDGPFAIERPEDRQAAEPNVVALVRSRLAAPVDGYVLACFDDIAISQLRQIVDVPVISMAEAGIRDALGRGGPFTIVTTVHEAIPAIEILRRRYGASSRCTIRAAGIGVADANSQSDLAERKLFETVEQAVEADRAEAIVLGSGAFAGRAQALEARFGIPFIDGLTTAIVAMRDAS